MSRFHKKHYPLYDDFWINSRGILGTVLALFFFLLFFQPFNSPFADFNKKLLVLSGFAVITLLLLILVRIVFPLLFPRVFVPEKWTLAKELAWHLTFLIPHPVAYVFYARYVALIEITFHAVVNTVLISIAVVGAFVVMNEYHFLKKQLRTLMNQYRGNDLAEKNDSQGAGEISFESENQSEKLVVFPEQVILIQSAGNYVEIIYRHHKKVSRQLIRNTLQRTEKQLARYPFLIRCHRSCIVNIHDVRKMYKTGEGLKLEMLDYEPVVTVSRQYLLSVKEALNQMH